LESPRWAGHNTFTVPEAAEILRISRWAAYEGVKKKEIPVIWIGRRCLVPRRALEKLLEGCRLMSSWRDVLKIHPACELHGDAA